MEITTIEVKKAGQYMDGTGRIYELESGKNDVNPKLAARLVETNPDTISVVGSSTLKQEPEENVFN